MHGTTLKDHVNIHEGEKFLVCGMGTSIDQYPVSFYENWPGVTIGVNEITDLFIPTYVFDVNKNHDIEENYFWTGDYEIPIGYEYMSPSDNLDIEKTGKLSMRGSGVVPAFTCAYQMGASEIYLIGVDFKRGANGAIYYHGCPKTPMRDYQLIKDDPEVDATLRLFHKAFKRYGEVGVEVFNLSHCSRLMNIDVIDLDHLYRRI